MPASGVAAGHPRGLPSAAPDLRSSAQRGAVLLLAAVALALIHLPWRPRTLCVLRTLTGIPCPLCGGTTAAVHVGRGDLLGGVRASPLAVLGAAAFVTAPLLRRPQLSSRHVWLLVLTAAAAAELYQLVRFGLL